MLPNERIDVDTEAGAKECYQFLANLLLTYTNVNCAYSPREQRLVPTACVLLSTEADTPARFFNFIPDKISGRYLVNLALEMDPLGASIEIFQQALDLMRKNDMPNLANELQALINHESN